MLTVCFVAHHIRDQPEFVDFFICCSESAVLHITSEIILNLWISSSAAQSLLFCTSHHRSSRILDFFSCCSQFAVLHITSEIILNLCTSSLLLIVCCVAHHIKDRHEFVDLAAFTICCGAYHIREHPEYLDKTAAVHRL
jgi:hypothetical protein